MEILSLSVNVQSLQKHVELFITFSNQDTQGLTQIKLTYKTNLINTAILFSVTMRNLFGMTIETSPI